MLRMADNGLSVLESCGTDVRNGTNRHSPVKGRMKWPKHALTTQ